MKPLIGKYRYRNRPDGLYIMCISGPEKHREWRNACAAARALGFASKTSIVESCERGYIAHGREFRYLYPDGRLMRPDGTPTRRRGPVPVWAGSMWYPSIHAAARALRVPSSSFDKALLTGRLIAKYGSLPVRYAKGR
jgi:hypothetical protein